MDASALLDLLGNGNRRRILRLLARKPCYVTEISEHLGVSPKAVIDHLGKLEEAGLIESRVDEKRRKYFHISENLRLEVTLAPYDFGMKSAYPASPGLDLSRCQYLSLEISDGHPHGDGTEPGAGEGESGRIDAAEVSDLVEELDELEDLERELSLAQRWVQGRITSVLEELGEAIDSEESLDTEILAALADGAAEPGEIGNAIGAPPPLVEERLRRLERREIIERDGGEWALANS
jgi:ArsR family transcriptional regulator